MNYMCIGCKEIFRANSDNDVKWKYDYPICTDCTHEHNTEEEQEG